MSSDSFLIDLLVFVVFARLAFAVLLFVLEQLGLKEHHGVKVSIREGRDDERR